MTDYILRVKDVEVNDTVDIPDSARDVEIEYYSVETGAGIGGGDTQVERARIKYLEKLGESVL